METLKDKKIQPFFEKGLSVKVETEILLPGSRVCRPDRVILNGNKAIVIDFKTGVRKENYKEQLNDYAQALMGMGYSSVEKYLVYIDETSVEEVV